MQACCISHMKVLRLTQGRHQSCLIADRAEGGRGVCNGERAATSCAVLLQLHVVLHTIWQAVGCHGRMFTQVDSELLQLSTRAAGWGPALQWCRPC